jgi:hypothetical protein
MNISWLWSFVILIGTSFLVFGPPHISGWWWLLAVYLIYVAWPQNDGNDGDDDEV